jgi:hypothetical protein
MSLQELINWHARHGVELDIGRHTTTEEAMQHLVDNDEVPRLNPRSSVEISNSFNDLTIDISIHDYEMFCNSFPKNKVLDIEFTEHACDCISQTFRDHVIIKPNNYPDLVKYFLIMKRLKVEGF